MKVSVYIKKSDFDNFFIWANRLSQGIVAECPVHYSHDREEFVSPVQLYLDAREYAMIQDTEKGLAELKESHGGEMQFRPEPLETDKIVMQSILLNAKRHDLEVDLVNTALELTKHIPGITSLEAMIIAEREWIVGKDVMSKDI